MNPQPPPFEADPAPMAHALATLNALPHPILWVAERDLIIDANPAAEAFFETSRPMLRRKTLGDLCGERSPILDLFRQAVENHATFNEYGVEFAPVRGGPERLIDIFIAPLTEPTSAFMVMLQERTIADKMSKQLTHRGAARSVASLSAMLAHEIKNPLAGIRGAAQLLEGSVLPDDQLLTTLIRDESDRILRLVDRFEAFSDGRPVVMEALNIPLRP